MARDTTTPETTKFETIKSYTVYKHGFIIKVVINIMDGDPAGDGAVDQREPPLNYTIQGDLYRAIMSHHPTWAPTKPEEMFGQAEIWACIDAIRNGTTLTIGTETGKSKDKY